jgi:hypothetical protein
MDVGRVVIKAVDWVISHVSAPQPVPAESAPAVSLSSVTLTYPGGSPAQHQEVQAGTVITMGIQLTNPAKAGGFEVLIGYEQQTGEPDALERVLAVTFPEGSSNTTVQLRTMRRSHWVITATDGQRPQVVSLTIR